MGKILKPLKKSFGKILEARRVEVGFRTKRAFADAIGADPAQVSRWESGRFSPGEEYIPRIKEVLKVDDSFFEGPLAPQPEPQDKSIVRLNRELDNAYSEISELKNEIEKLRNVVGVGANFSFDSGQFTLDRPHKHKERQSSSISNQASPVSSDLISSKKNSSEEEKQRQGAVPSHFRSPLKIIEDLARRYGSDPLFESLKLIISQSFLPIHTIHSSIDSLKPAKGEVNEIRDSLASSSPENTAKPPADLGANEGTKSDNTTEPQHFFEPFPLHGAIDTKQSSLIQQELEEARNRIREMEGQLKKYHTHDKVASPGVEYSSHPELSRVLNYPKLLKRVVSLIQKYEEDLGLAPPLKKPSQE